jgi:membrane protease YdiL (CAAX protease family)
MGLLPERSAQFEAFVAPARARPALWRLALGTAFAAAFWLTAVAALLPLAARLGPAGGRVPVVLYLASFAALIAGLAVAARLLQRRRLASLIGPAGLRPRRFALGAAVVAGVGAVAALPLLALAPPVRQTGLGTWAAWLPLALPALLVQTAAEELAFRGYLMQGLAARFRSPLAWWAAPAVLFGLLHWNPAQFGGDAWLVAAAAAAVGLILGDVTARTGDLSLAMGMHFANNAVAVLVLAPPSPLAALSLYLLPLDPADPRLRPLLLLDLATTLAAYATWLALRTRR